MAPLKTKFTKTVKVRAKVAKDRECAMITQEQWESRKRKKLERCQNSAFKRTKKIIPFKTHTAAVI